MEIDLSSPAERVACALDQAIEWRGKPQAIRSDNSPEHISIKLTLWAENTFCQETGSKMLTSSATTEPYGMTGWNITCLNQ